jgi:hypothetical protein
VEEVRLRQLVQDRLRVDDERGAVPDVDALAAGAGEVPPDVERRPEERLDVRRARAAGRGHELDVAVAALVVREVEPAAAELAHVRRARTHLRLLVDDRRVVLLGRGVEGEHGPAVLDREEGRERVVHEPRPELRLERVHVELRVAVEEPLRRVAAVLVHRAEHQEPEAAHPPPVSPA